MLKVRCFTANTRAFDNNKIISFPSQIKQERHADVKEANFEIKLVHSSRIFVFFIQSIRLFKNPPPLPQQPPKIYF